jgi:heme/copper-type cytochrome/quinol oxidase subunit 3
MTDYAVVEGESSEILERNLFVASRLWASATVFFFFAFFFAYFYLRSLNGHGLWKPKGVHVAQGWGIVIAACMVGSAVLLWSAQADQRADRRPRWRLKGVAAAVLGLAAVVVQIVAWANLGFGPTDGGYASVYVGWTGLYTLFVLGSLFWLETSLAVSYRYREHAMGPTVPVEPGHASGDRARTAHDIENPVPLNIAQLSALTFYWAVLAGVGVVTWVVLYLF